MTDGRTEEGAHPVGLCLGPKLVSSALWTEPQRFLDVVVEVPVLVVLKEDLVEHVHQFERATERKKERKSVASL